MMEVVYSPVALPEVQVITARNIFTIPVVIQVLFCRVCL
jgi:hypothetical protein